ncbi:hypothetical protein Tco_0845505, partial [Tanacetum coccineum]
YPREHPHEPEVLKSRLGSSLNVPAVKKHVRSGPLSMNHAHRYGDPASKRGSCIPEAHNGQPN